MSADSVPDAPRRWAPGLPVLPIPAVYLLHGKGGSPQGSVRKIEEIIAQNWPGLDFVRPQLPHSDPRVLAEESVVSQPAIGVDCRGNKVVLQKTSV